MRALRRLPLPAVLAVALAACSGKVGDLPAGAQVSCTSSSECPSGTVCQPLLKRCVPAASGDRQPPGIVAGTAHVSPAVAGAGAIVTVTFEVDEDLAADPVVRYAGADAPLGLPRRSGRTYTVEFSAAPGDGAGAHPIVAQLVDLVGNVAATVPVGSVTLDFTPPSAGTPVVTPRFARAGTAVQVSVGFDEALGADPVLAVSGGPTFAAARASGNVWTFTRTLDGTEPAGSVELALSAADPAGNPLVRRFPDAIVFDFSPPTVTAVTVHTPTLRAGDTFGAEVDFDEPLGAPPTLALVPAGGGAPIPVVASAITADTFALSVPIPLLQPDGDVGVWITGAADRAGNPMDPWLVGTVHLDSTPPAVAGLAPDHANRLYRAGDAVSVSFTASELLVAAPVVRLETLPVPLDLPCLPGGAPRSWTCTSALLTGAERPESVVNVSVRVADAAGNVAVSAAAVVLDFTPPAPLAAAPGQPAFPAGGTITYTVSVTEPLASPPALGVARQGVPVPGFFGAPASQSATSFTWSRAVPAGLDGDYAVSVQLVDEALNAGGPYAGAGFTVDTAAPAVVGPISVLPAKAAFRAGDRPAVTFTVGEDIPLPAARLGTAAPIPATCAPAGARTFTCTLDRALVATDLPEGPAALLLTLADAAGNVGYGSKALVLDYTPPSVVGGQAVTQLVAGAGILRTDLSALGPGSRLDVTFLSSEPLASDPGVWAVNPGTGEQLPLTRTSANGTSYVYTLTVDATVRPPAAWSVRWSPTDLAGNGWPAGSEPTLATVTIDGERPTTPAIGPASAPLLVWERTPWGSATTTASSYRLVGKAGSTSGADLVVAWDAATSGLEVARGPIAGGTFTLPLSSDPRELYVSTVDGAGNVSPRTRVVDVAWTASLAGKVAGSTFENPHRLDARRWSTPALAQADAVEVGGTIGRAGDGLVATTDGASLYRAAAGLTAPSPRRRFSLAHDAGRGRLVLFGGTNGAGLQPGDTWEWDGQAWRQMAPLDPEGDGNPPEYDDATMVYAPALGGVLLLSSAPWLWDGVSWRSLYGTWYPIGFRPGTGAAWDEGRGVLVVFGWYAQTWEFDGKTWRDATPAAPGDSPPARSHCGMAYDRTLGAVVVFGGKPDVGAPFNDVWSWDGTRWTAVTPDGGTPLAGRSAAAVAWDPGAGELVVQGGQLDGGGEDGRTWALRTTAGVSTWFDVTPASGPVPMSEHAAATDLAAGTVLLLGDVAQPELRAWSDPGPGTWTVLAPGDAEGDGNPVWSTGASAAMAWNATRGETVYHAGATRDTWQWNRVGWRHAATGAGPSARTGASLGSAAGLTILYGGTELGSPWDASGDTWGWDGSSWALLEPSPARPADPAQPSQLRRRNAGLAVNGSGQLLRFGGSDFSPTSGNRCYSDLWRWTGVTWIQLGGDPAAWASNAPAAADACTARGNLAWDAARGSLLYYLPSTPVMWEWLPASNSWVRHDFVGGYPSGNAWAFFYDTTLGAPVVFADDRVYYADLDANTYHAVPLANVSGLGAPLGGIAAFDGGAGRAVAVHLTPWTWESGTTAWPAHLLHVDFSRANGPDPSACVNRATCPIQQVDLRWWGGASSPAQPGTLVQVWTGGWRDAVTSAATPASMLEHDWSWTSASPFPASSLFQGSSRELVFALRPRGPNGAAVSARVQTDAVDVTVRYRRP
jgi:hypothetical protein